MQGYRFTLFRFETKTKHMNMFKTKEGILLDYQQYRSDREHVTPGR